MVKGGTKRKIEIKKIENRFSMVTSFTKRSNGLHSKASELCLLTGAQIAVLATPSSSKSNVSFFSFGHSSVEAVVFAFLAGKSPPPLPVEIKETREDLGICMARKNLGLGFWWDDDERFKSLEDIMEAIESIKSLLTDVRALRSDPNQNPNQREEKKNERDVVSHHDGTADQTLALDYNLPPANHFNDDTTEHDQILSTSDSLSNNNNNNANLDEWSDMDLDKLLNDSDDELPENQTGEEDHQIVSLSEKPCNSNNANLDEWSDTDLDKLLNDSDGELPENQTGEEDHHIVSLPEKNCNNVEEDMGLDFETIFEGLYSDDETNEFVQSLLMI